MMKKHLSGFLVAAVLGSVATVGGCGDAKEEGTTVEVDKAKEEALTNSMEGYYTNPPKSAPNPN